MYGAPLFKLIFMPVLQWHIHTITSTSSTVPSSIMSKNLWRFRVVSILKVEVTKVPSSQYWEFGLIRPEPPKLRVGQLLFARWLLVGVLMYGYTGSTISSNTVTTASALSTITPMERLFINQIQYLSGRESALLDSFPFAACLTLFCSSASSTTVTYLGCEPESM